MRLALALALTLAADPAVACHRFHHWAYPYPQPKCTVRLAQEARPAPDASYYVEITKLPEAWERALGLEELKSILGDSQ